MTVTQKSIIFWVVTCSWVEIYCRFAGKYSLHPQNRSANGGNIFHQDICKCLPHYIMSHHRCLQTLSNHTLSRYKTVMPGKVSNSNQNYIILHILSSHSGHCKDCSLLGCNAVHSGRRLPRLERKILPLLSV